VDINAVRVTAGEGGEAKLADVANWRTSQLFDAGERLALDYAERMTSAGGKIDDGFFSQLRAHFTEPEIVELTAAIAFENFRSKFNPALGVEAQGFCLVPAAR
jgi:alkylhydroperoxidase family enzyme